jgi:4-alpha-glucanotransferase
MDNKGTQRGRTSLLQPLLPYCQTHLAVHPITTTEALKTESWPYNHSSQVGGNTTCIKPVQRLR